MKRCLLLLLICLSAPLLKMSGQHAAPLFTGKLENASFKEFAIEAELQTGLKIYYLDEWVDKLNITLSGSEIPLLPLLDSLLNPLGINYYLDPWDRLFLTDTIQLSTQLPQFGVEGVKEEVDLLDRQDSVFTATEQKYMAGRRVREPEIIHLGKDELLNGRQRVVFNGVITEAGSGEPLIGVTVYLEPINRGTSTNLDGQFL